MAAKTYDEFITDWYKTKPLPPTRDEVWNAATNAAEEKILQSATPTNSAMAEICPKCKEDGVRIVDTYGNDVCTHCGYEYSGKLHQ